MARVHHCTSSASHHLQQAVRMLMTYSGSALTSSEVETLFKCLSSFIEVNIVFLHSSGQRQSFTEDPRGLHPADQPDSAQPQRLPAGVHSGQLRPAGQAQVMLASYWSILASRASDWSILASLTSNWSILVTRLEAPSRVLLPS